MKKVTAYEALDKSIHKTKEDAARVSIQHLAGQLCKDQRGTCMGPAGVAFLVKYRDKIMPILEGIDMPECETV